MAKLKDLKLYDYVIYRADEMARADESFMKECGFLVDQKAYIVSIGKNPNKVNKRQIQIIFTDPDIAQKSKSLGGSIFVSYKSLELLPAIPHLFKAGDLIRSSDKDSYSYKVMLVHKHSYDIESINDHDTRKFSYIKNELEKYYRLLTSQEIQSLSPRFKVGDFIVNYDHGRINFCKIEKVHEYHYNFKTKGHPNNYASAKNFDIYWNLAILSDEYLKGKSPLNDKPAISLEDGTKLWVTNDNLHRLSGPAIEKADGSNEYYLMGTRMNENDFQKHPDVIQYRKNILKTKIKNIS